VVPEAHTIKGISLKTACFAPVTRYVCDEIARKVFGFHVLLTPPYHPELQPIEMLWAQIKGEIVKIGYWQGSMSELVERVKLESTKVKTKMMVKVWRKCARQGVAYHQREVGGMWGKQMEEGGELEEAMGDAEQNVLPAELEFESDDSDIDIECIMEEGYDSDDDMRV